MRDRNLLYRRMLYAYKKGRFIELNKTGVSVFFSPETTPELNIRVPRNFNHSLFTYDKPEGYLIRIMALIWAIKETNNPKTK